MTFTVQWATLALLVGCTAWRFPSMLRGHNRSMFWIFACMSICVSLSIHPLYLAVDGVLGQRNLANVVLRLSLFAVFYLLGSKVAAAYNSAWARRLMHGPMGIAVLVICSLGIWISYFLSDVAGSSVGMASLSTQTSIEVYKWFGLVYVGYVAAVVVIPTARAAFSARRVLERIAALCMSIGFALTAVLIPLNALELPSNSIETSAAFTAILFVAVGLALVWVSFLRGPPAKSTTAS